MSSSKDSSSSSNKGIGPIGLLCGALGVSIGSLLTYYYFKIKPFSQMKYQSMLSSGTRKQWKYRSILSIHNFTKYDILVLFNVANDLKNSVENNDNKALELCKNKVLSLLFYEPSTRTNCSFQAAMLRLGGKVINIQDVKTSSVKKGETLQDTITTLSQYSNVIVQRHPEKGSCHTSFNALQQNNKNVPILNAGDGSGEHPTQALLDLYTIYNEHQSHDLDSGLTISFVGDLKYGRTVHSLLPALSLFKNIKINLISPEILSVPQVIINKVSNNIKLKVLRDINEEVMKSTDILYVTRIQKERFNDSNEYDKVKNAFKINNQLLNKFKSSCMLMHPLPRINEISKDCDENHRSKYFVQMKYGMFMRMALLALTTGSY